MTSNQSAIHALLQQKYQSLTHPIYTFVQEALQQQPYASLLHRLSSRFHIDEDTDTNVDVSFMYILRRANALWGLRLSMVGPFAVFWRVLPNNQFSPVISADEAVSDDEGYVLRILDTYGITRIAPSELMQHIPLHRMNDEEPTSTLYQGLFGDYDGLPWA